MKRLIITIGLIISTNLVATARQSGPLKPTPAREQSLLARVTVYWASGGRGSDRYTRQHKSSTGQRLRTGHCAVDPRKIPYGSKIIFPDRTGLLAVDTGTAVRTRKAARYSGRSVHEKNALVIDRFFETKGQALAWAKRNPAFMTVKVLPPSLQRQPASPRGIQTTQPANVVQPSRGSITGSRPLFQPNAQRVAANNPTPQQQTMSRAAGVPTEIASTSR